ADGLSQMGLTVDATKEAIGSLISAGVNNPGLPGKAFKMLPPAARAEAVTSAAAWVKAYTTTAEFRQQYAKLRGTRKPEAPTWDTTPEQELQKEDEAQKKQLAESTQAIASLPAEQRKEIEAAMKAAAQVAASQNTPEMRQIRLNAIKGERAARTKEYQDDLVTWNRDYPEDPKPVIARRLREFLALSAGVDFNAKVNTNGAFENAAYQAKSSQWKMCYRAGRDATAAA